MPISSKKRLLATTDTLLIMQSKRNEEGVKHDELLGNQKQTNIIQAGIELGLNQAETVSLELPN